MNKRIIYTICMYGQYEGWIGRVIEKFWERTTLKMMKEYAQRTNSDFKVIMARDSEFPKEIQNINILSHGRDSANYRKANLSKFFCIKDFIESDYEEMLLLDVDTYICPSAKNIFLELDNNDIILPHGSPPDHKEKLIETLIEVYKSHSRKDYDELLKKYLSEELTFWGGGLILLNKKGAKPFAEHFPFDLEKFLLDRGFTEWPHHLTDESILNAFILLNNVDVQKLDRTFITAPQEDDNRPQLDEDSVETPLCRCRNSGASFIHYWGDTKYKLFDLLENNEEEKK
tara:strand:+ start:2124 stop:2981 length:858 start_codon:yes stop_codon:yes gene_type:complete